jgi:hypothetical protein
VVSGSEDKESRKQNMTCEELRELIEKHTKCRDDVPPHIVKAVLLELIALVEKEVNRANC